MSRYFELTRTHTYSLIFVLPLFLLYELGAVSLAGAGSNLRNGADVLLRTILYVVGVQGTAALAIGLMLVAIVLIVREQRRRTVPFRPSLFLGMASESLAYALAFGVVIGGATREVLEMLAIQGGEVTQLGAREALILSLGAGLYEELVFRVMLVGGLFSVFRALGASARQAGIFSVILAALVFSAFHYVGPYGDPLTAASFIFRLLAGVAFSVLFLLRGFGITAWTHSLYDIFFLLALSG